MKRARYLFLVHFLLTTGNVGGVAAARVLDDYPVTGINISLHWEGVTDHLPEGVRVNFLSERRPRKKDRYLSAGKRRRGKSASGTLFGCNLQL